MSKLDDENFRAEIFIRSIGGEFTENDSGYEDGGGLLDNLLWQPDKPTC